MPTTTDIPTTDAALTAVLHGRGQRATPQRLVLHRVLREAGRHVTAEELQRAAASRLPGLSTPAVYATLELFEELGIVRRLSAPGGATLYDPRLDDHDHVVCRRCGAVEDLEARLDRRPALAAARRAGFGAERVDVAVSGLCQACSD